MNHAIISNEPYDSYSHTDREIPSATFNINILNMAPSLGNISPLSDTDNLDGTTPVKKSNSKFESETSIIKKEVIRSSFIAEQEWEGYVTRIDSKYFYATLLDLTNSGVEEEAQFELTEVSPNNDQLLKEGALFRWSIGYERQKGGTRRRSSSIIFRRLPAWSKREIKSSQLEAEQLINEIQWE